MSDQLPMKPKKNSKGVSCPFFFLEKKHQQNLESAYSDKPQLAISGTNHTVTSPNGRVIHRKMISKPIDFNQENTNRGIGPRGPDGRFVKSPSKHQRAMIIDSDTESETPPMEIDSPKTPELSIDTTIKKSTLGRGRPKLIRDRASPNTANTPMPGNNIGPLTITTSNMTDTELRIRSTTIIQRSPKPVHICRNRWKLYRLLPFPERVLRISGHTNNFSRKN